MTKTQLTQMPPALPWSRTHHSCGMATMHCMATTCCIGNNVLHWQRPQHVALATTCCIGNNTLHWWQCIAWQLATNNTSMATNNVSHGDNPSYGNNVLHGDNPSHGDNASHGDNTSHGSMRCMVTMRCMAIMRCMVTMQLVATTANRWVSRHRCNATPQQKWCQCRQIFLLNFCHLTFSNFPFYTVLWSTLGSSGVHFIFPGCWRHLSPHWKSRLIVFTQRFPWLRQSHQKSPGSLKKGPYSLKTRWVCPGFNKEK